MKRLAVGVRPVAARFTQASWLPATALAPVKLLFFPWLEQQRKRDDAIGDLARLAVADPKWPRGSYGYKIEAYLDKQGAPAEIYAALALAKYEWKATGQ